MTTLLLSFQLTAFSLSLSAAPDADTAVAVAVGLVRTGRAPVEAPISVEVTSPGPSAKASLQKPESGRIEWVPTCNEHGCRLMPHIVSPEAPGTAPRVTQDATATPSTPAGVSAESYDNGPCWHGKRRFFSKRR